ncbi:hypothetical protein [Streptomyces catenulae]|uniref:Integral membrane protein n=1 Tax=Streptomyces catenulae TaxID=66875 RepID=A0ABV2Z373_9ACTN|nr:hypothetical protein [Streptomyces catenulae]
MGWAVLYIAFGCVALWLLAEVLLQHKARLRWRLLAFTGFLGVVAGVVLPSVIVIALGAAAFATGQTYVTLSFRRGFTTGWSLRKAPVENNRRRRARSTGRRPALHVSDIEETTGPADTPEAPDTPAPTDAADAPAPYDAAAPLTTPDGYPPHDGYGASPQPGQDGGWTPDAHGAPAFGGQDGYVQDGYTQGGYTQDVYAPQPLPDETGQYGVYSPDARSAPHGSDAYAPAFGHGGGYGPGAHDAYADPYGSYAAYGGDQGAAAGSPFGAQAYPPHDPYAPVDPYAQQPYGSAYGTSLQDYGDTPPGGVWVPQQRDGVHPPGEPPYPPTPHHGHEEQQYRY